MLVVVNDPIIFHFNCPCCGAHPGVVPLNDFLERWRRSPQSDLDALIGLYATILLEIQCSQVRWKTKRFAGALERVLRWLGQIGVRSDSYPHLDVEEEIRCMEIDCALCLTPRGPRSTDRYFTVWSNAHKVQVANLLYETDIILFAVARALPRWASPRMLSQLGHLLVLNHKALVALGLFECPYCGRHTTCLYGEGSTKNPYRCRWCLDRSGFFGVRFSCEITAKGIELKVGMDDLTPERLSDSLVPFFEGSGSEPD